MYHDRVTISSATNSCGIAEISRISEDLNDVLFQVANFCYHPARGSPPAFFTMSNLATEVTASHRLAKRIQEQRFGTIWDTPPALNPKTGNVIKIWVWVVDHEPFKKWYYQSKAEAFKKAAGIEKD